VIEPQQFELTDELRRAENIFHNTKRNFLILGSAGTGKSFLLKRLVANSHKNVQVLAYTGLAALNAGGITIHKFFGFELGLQARSHLRLKGIDEKKENNRRAFRSLETLLIDEVSMLRADLLDAVDVVLREHGPRPGEPFGGVQIGLFGDVLQLPPIVEDKDHMDQMFRPQANNPSMPISDEGWVSPWFFDSFAYRTAGFLRLTLTRDFRQETETPIGNDFVRSLHRLREGRMQPEDFDLINSRVCNERPDQALSLVTTNDDANNENTKHFNLLPGRSQPYQAVRADNWPTHWMGKSYEPVPETVEIKKDAWVLVCANVADAGLVNGSLGTVLRFDDEKVVLLVGLEEKTVQRYTWRFPIWRWDGENKRMVNNGETTYTQMPLKLAWAMTIHKAQGQTVDGPMWVDLGPRVWSGGQTYVALSRVRRLDQLHLRRSVRNEDVLVERRAWQFLTEGDAPTAFEETRSLAVTTYRETKKVKDKTVEERERAEQILKRAEALLTDATAKLQESNRVEARIVASEKRISSALEQAKKAGWLKRLFGNY
jgi:ATP-dependent DNA helicase PIF1